MLKQSRHTLRGLRAVQATIACVVLVIGGYVFLSTANMVVDCWFPMPWWDEWHEVVTGQILSWSWWFGQHNEHRILFPRLFFVLDYLLVNETYRISFAIPVMFQAGLVICIVWLSRGTRLVERPGTLWVCGLSAGLLFWAIQYGNFCSWLTGIQYFGVQLAAALAFLTVCIARPTILTLIVVIILNFISVYSLASGLLVPLLTVGIAVWRGHPRRHVAVLCGAAIALWAAYLVGYQTPPKPIELSSHVTSILLHFLVQLGGPFSGGNYNLAAVLGLVGLAVFFAFGFRAFANPDTPHEQVFVVICTFILGQAAITAFGRVSFESALTSRYASASLLFWLSLILLVSARTTNASLRRVSVMATSVAVLILICINQRPFTTEAGQWALRRKLAIPPVLADVSDNSRLSGVYPRPDLPLRFRSKLLAAKTVMFADEWTRWLGTPLMDHVSLIGGSDCAGSFDKASLVSETPSVGWRALGRTWSNKPGNIPNKIIFADGDGQIVGFGVGMANDPIVGGLATEDSKRSLEWSGAFKSADAESITAYALFGHGSDVCALGRAAKIGSATRLLLANYRSDDAIAKGGSVENLIVASPETNVMGSGDVTILGWGLLSGDDNRIVIATNLPVKSHSLAILPRPDIVSAIADPRLAFSGIKIDLILDKTMPSPSAIQLCVWTDDPIFGRHILQNLVQPDICDSAKN
jgi:hypothetical protein